MQDSHSYYGKRIGNRMQAFEWYQFEWPSVTFSRSRLFNVKQVILTMAEKSYMTYRTATFSMTLNDPYPQFQGHAILW